MEQSTPAPRTIETFGYPELPNSEWVDAEAFEREKQETERRRAIADEHFARIVNALPLDDTREAINTAIDYATEDSYWFDPEWTTPRNAFTHALRLGFRLGQIFEARR